MQPGDVIAERFEVEQRMGSGGMGEVYRARDRASAKAVAVKVLLERNASGTARFLREAEVLAELSHPGIVRHVAHGGSASGAPYLAMEWLSGEDLGSRLHRGALTVDETITLAARAADALAVVHGRGIVHRDLKPSNLFLVDGDVTRLKLLDFGIARVREATRMTQTGAILGTVGYMAPEQARSEGEIDARADVFSLGCVLYECLTGEPAFTGANIVAVLAKILFAEVPRVREIRPEVPPSLEGLCARMLAKDPRDRLRDGAALLDAIGAVGMAATQPGMGSERSAGSAAPALTTEERRVLSVVMMSAIPSADGSAVQPEAETRMAVDLVELRRTAASHGGQTELLVDGSILITLVGTGIATDQAAQAARCALALRAHAGDRAMALATGRAEVKRRLPAGEAIDRAVQMLADLVLISGHTAPIAIDEVTAGLLDARFEVIETEAGLTLRGEQALAAGARTLLGKPTACVGRDREIGTLATLFAECVEEPRAHAVLLTAPAGMGKTRVAHEFLRRVRQRDEPVAVWIARGDPMRKGAAFGLLGQALAGALGLHDGEPIEMRRETIRARVGEDFSGADAQRVAEFLGEIVGTPFPEEQSIPLRAARQDAQLMGDQMLRVWVDFLEQRCSAAPVLLVLEDLHWGDLPTVRFVDDALRRLKDKSWMVLALARPEVHELFPKLWTERNVQEVRIGELSPKASARLVRQVLGEGVSAETAERLVAQADGNAFHLEELIRATAEGNRGALPETVLAMLQGRIEALDAELRRVLRAASVFGEVFWRGAVQALLGDGVDSILLDEHLEQLERLEWISARPEAKFQGEGEMVFRHALVREAAYGMLTEEDRSLGHRLAGAWLEEVGEPKAAVMAEHFERGGDSARAAGAYQRAAVQALEANDFSAVLSWIDRALPIATSVDARGELARLRAEALAWRADYAESERWARMAMEALPVGSATWYDALSRAGWAAFTHGDWEGFLSLVDTLVRAFEEAATGPAVGAAASMAGSLLLGGSFDRADALHARIQAVATCFRDDPAVNAAVLHLGIVREFSAGNIGAARTLCASVLRCHEQAGDLRRTCGARLNLGFTESQLGAYPEAVVLLRAAYADAERMGLETILPGTQHTLGVALGHLGALAEARALALQAVALVERQGTKRLECEARADFAWILRSTGELQEAEAEARRAVEVVEAMNPMQVLARGVLAEVLLARGRPEEALVEARKAMALLGSLSRVVEGEALARLVHAEALDATGDHAAACVAIAGAQDRLIAQAARIDDPTRQKTFLENVPENARTLALARQWLGEPAEGPP